MDVNGGLTPEEMSLLTIAGDLFSAFTKLPVYGREHAAKVCEAVRVIQDLLLMRPTFRAINQGRKIMGGQQ